MDVSDPDGSIEDADGVVKEEISLMTFSEWLGTTLKVAMRKPHLRFFVLCS